MRRRIAFLVCATLPILGSCGGNPAPHAGQSTLQAQSMQHMLADVLAVRGYVYGEGSRDDAQSAATDLVSWSQKMGELFPPGRASTDYVDMSPERVNGAPLAMSRASEQLLRVVRTGDRAAIGTQLSQTEHDGCGACHLSGTR